MKVHIFFGSGDYRETQELEVVPNIGDWVILSNPETFGVVWRRVIDKDCIRIQLGKLVNICRSDSPTKFAWNEVVE